MAQGTLQKAYNKKVLDNLDLKERIIMLEGLLMEYGRHSMGCSAQYNTTHSKYPCRCGWDREREQALNK